MDDTDRIHAVARAAREEEQRRCLAWVAYADVMESEGEDWHDLLLGGIKGGEWPPEEGR